MPQDTNDEPAVKLLERILAERRAQWEIDLRAKGKDPKKAKYVESEPRDTVATTLACAKQLYQFCPASSV